MTYQLPGHCEWRTKLDTPCPLLLPCSSCKELLPATEFSTLRREKSRKDILGNSKMSHCKECSVKASMKKPLPVRLLYAARKRAKLKDLPFDIEVEDIVVPTHCPILGIPMESLLGKGAVTIPERNNSPSLDRINNKKGYVKGNVAVISMRANHVKADGTTAEITAIADFMKRHDEKIAEQEKKDNPWLHRLL